MWCGGVYVCQTNVYVHSVRQTRVDMIGDERTMTNNGLVLCIWDVRQEYKLDILECVGRDVF